MNTLVRPPAAYATWAMFQESMAPAAWHSWTAASLRTYTSALRAGLRCACGKTVKQPLLASDAPVAKAGRAEVDLTLDDDDDEPPPGGVPAVAATCVCGGSVCAACGMQLMSPGSRGSAPGVDLSAPDPSVHLGCCPLAPLHAIVSAIERMRRLYLDCDPVVASAVALASAKPAPAPAALVPAQQSAAAQAMGMYAAMLGVSGELLRGLMCGAQPSWCVFPIPGCRAICKPRVRTHGGWRRIALRPCWGRQRQRQEGVRNGIRRWR